MTKGRVLLVDDQEDILESLSAVLKDEGHEVISARDGQEALHLVQSDNPDLVFLDIWIPGIDGIQTLKAIRKIDPRCSVIMMSGHGTIETAVKAIKLGATDYLEKPLNLEDVLHLVDKAITTRASLSRSREGSNGIPGEFIGNSPKAERLRKALLSAAGDTRSVWLLGEKGTGKEFVARLIHHMAGKDRISLIKVRCSDLTPDTIEDSVLARQHWLTRGRNSAKRLIMGTLLLVRIDRLEGSLRPRLADLIRRVEERNTGLAGDRGGLKVISTSLIDPGTLIREHDFPQELADCLGQNVIRLPNLRERREDIPLLVTHFLEEAAAEFDRALSGADDQAICRLCAYAWPGNIKELKILMEHVVMTAPGPQITVNDLLIPREQDEGVCSDIRDPSVCSLIQPVQTANDGNNGALSEASREESEEGTEDRVHHANEMPSLRQKTLRGRVVMYGQGLHSGVKTGLTLSPLPPSSGIIFGHITSEGTVHALLNNVQSTEFSTSLKRNGSLAKTIEHLMAVFHVYGLSNVLVKISGEVPIMDGSALDFCDLVENAELITQEESIEAVRIMEPLELPLPPGSQKSMRIEPSDCLEVEYYLDYPPPVGSMHMTFRCNSPEHFKREIAPARTFGFVKDMRMMDEMGLAGGGRLSNVVLMDDEKVINPPLRFPDEFVRHKVLDIIGDFYLLGRPFIGKITARLTGHTENISMLKIVAEKMGLV